MMSKTIVTIRKTAEALLATQIKNDEHMLEDAYRKCLKIKYSYSHLTQIVSVVGTQLTPTQLL